MSATFTFKPIQASLFRNTEIIGKMAPYCVIKVGSQEYKGQVCKNGGRQPTWTDSITIPFSDYPTCEVKIKDRDLIKDDKIGSFEIDLHEIESEKRVKRWYSIFHKDKPAGELLMEITYNQNFPSHATVLPLSLAASHNQYNHGLHRQNSADSILSEASPKIPHGRLCHDDVTPKTVPVINLMALISSVRQTQNINQTEQFKKQLSIKRTALMGTEKPVHMLAQQSEKKPMGPYLGRQMMMKDSAQPAQTFNQRGMSAGRAYRL